MTDAVQVELIKGVESVISSILAPLVLYMLVKPTARELKISLDGVLDKALTERGDKRYIEGAKDEKTRSDAEKGSRMP